MADIARLANVSISTVSRALNNNPRLSAQTRQRVNELAKSLNYSINAGAQLMRGKRLPTVSVVFPYQPTRRRHFQDPFFMALIGSIGDALIDAHHSMLIVGVDNSELDLLTQSYETGQSIGIIMLGQEDHHQRLNELAVRGVPLVVWGARLPDQAYCSVGSDNVMGGRQATAHLLATGARRIAFFGDRRLPEFGHRYDGYLLAHQAIGLQPDPALYCPVPLDAAEVRREVARLLAENMAFDGIVCCADRMALNAVAALRQQGLQVPVDVQVVGYDDVSLAADAHPPLTTVRQAIQVAGQALVDLLFAKLRGDPAASLVMPTTLVLRESTRGGP